jgi:hypothetical protein
VATRSAPSSRIIGSVSRVSPFAIERLLSTGCRRRF